MKTLFQGEFLSLALDDDGRTAWVSRTERSTAGFGRHDLDALAGALSSIDAARMGVIIDLRKAPGRNDAEFESSVVVSFHQIVGVFRSRAFLVATLAGKMQLMRLAPKFGSYEVFTDEAAARRFAAATTAKGE